MTAHRGALLAVAALLIGGVPTGASTAATNKLTVTLQGQGGTIVSVPAGIRCPPACSASFDSGAVVRLTATAAQNHRFVEWTTGQCFGQTSSTCEVPMNSADRAVGALFLPNATLQVAPRGPGAVRVLPAGLDIETGDLVTEPCAENDDDDDCVLAFVPGTRVTLTAIPEGGKSFAGWSEHDPDCRGTGACGLTAVTEKTVVATFSPLTLNIRMSSENARVTSSPAGIDCPDDCDAPFPAGSRVTLTATPLPGHTFRRWEYGCQPANAPTCVAVVNDEPTHAGLVLDNDDPPGQPGTINVRFEVLKQGDGSGKVTATNIDCGSACAGKYRFGDTVVLTAAPEGNSRFGGWGGVCAPDPTCALAVGPVTAIPAVFERKAVLTAALQRFGVVGRGTSRRVEARVQVNLTTRAVIGLSRAGRVLASRTVGLKPGASTLRLPVPRGVRAGPAQLRVGVQDPNGGVRNFRRTVRLPG